MAGPPPIGEYALVGDTRAAGLISREGSLDWLCLPRFDADPVFGRLVDPDQGGHFSLSARGAVAARRYRDGTAVVETEWRCPEGRALVTEGMALRAGGSLLPQMTLVRSLECVQGRVEACVLYEPRRGLPGRPPTWERRPFGIMCAFGGLGLALQTFPRLELAPGRECELELKAGERLTCVMTLADRTPAVLLPERVALDLLAATGRWWSDWSAGIAYEGPFRKDVVRSLITLRLLIYAPSGAPLAAPTTSLPEHPGGTRNWDYRYSWPRDAGIGSGAFTAAGKLDEGRAFLHWLRVANTLTRPRIEVLYTVDGTPGHQEREVPVAGYLGSRPVRVGNAASRQHQLDVYGWVVDTAWHLAEAGQRLEAGDWSLVAGCADFVAACWRQPDAGIWEKRGDPQHNVSSKLLAWLALDRSVRLAGSGGRRDRRCERWRRERDLLGAEIRERGFDLQTGSYVTAYGDGAVDASLLLLPMSELEAADSPRVAATVDRVRRELSAGGPLLYRYRPASDGIPEPEGAFLPCSFWLADALCRLGRLEEAAEQLAAAAALGGELGLLGEEVDPGSGRLLGNFPQAFTHSGLVLAAIGLAQATASRTPPRSSRR